MIVLDTNVLSELLKPQPSSKVTDWLDEQAVETLFLTSITRFELRFGVLRLAKGKRQDGLRLQVEGVLSLFEGRVLDFDSQAADCLAEIALRCEKAGRRAMAPDAYIAACAAARGGAVATRNVEHFEHTGVRVINPWELGSD